jgi:NADH-quinone oxidoreductase subunit E
MALPDALVREFDELVTHYPERRAALIPALHRCQEELGGWLSPDTLEDCAGYFGLEPVEVYGVASFYPMFHLHPVGEHVIGVCHNISCALRGAEELYAYVCQRTGVTDDHGHGGTSTDGRFTVKRLECQGACANAPMFDLDGTYHEDLDRRKVDGILAGLGSIQGAEAQAPKGADA